MLLSLFKWCSFFKLVSLDIFACLPLAAHELPVNLMKMYISCYRHASVFSKITKALTDMYFNF